MLSFLVRRVLQTVPIVLAVALLIFVLFSVIPGTFASSLSDDGRSVMDPAVVERMNKELGLNDPVALRFGRYVIQLAQLDLGTSFRTRQPVTRVLAERMGATLKLCFAAMAFAIVLGVPLGFVAALKPGSLADTRYLVLPAVALGVAPLALLARTTRAAVLEIMNADFVRTARSKGMSEGRVVRWHLARNALVIVLTTVGLQFGSVIGQAVVIEKLFSWPGLGSLLVDSVTLRDIPVVQGAILVIVLFFLVVNTLVDVLCALIDPRIKYS
jgi:peptide/nickel transport system permease protein